jgi:hypothetical protein
LATIVGTIQDSTGEGIGGATVTLVETSISTMTDAHGKFHLINSSTNAFPHGYKSLFDKIFLKKGTLIIILDFCNPATITFYDFQGRIILTYKKKLL